MCGIVGLYRASGCDEQELSRFRDILTHRGPDDAGLWISPDRRLGLAQRRLAIIDLTPAGNQPMCNEDGSIWLVYNGETYNYAELKHRLEGLGHRFRSHSDTETVIHAFEEWGLAGIGQLRGMFAFGLWDARRQSLCLVRDHTGIKPLFYYWDGLTFAFASEIKALLSLEALDRRIDRSALFDYLTYLYIPAPKTAYQHIRKLLPGHSLTFDGQGLTLTKYWDVPLDQTLPLSEEQAVQLTQERLAEAVMLNQVSDVPVGIFLSGGLDSSTVAAYLTRSTQEPVHSFSIGFDIPEHSELEYARLAAATFQTRHHEQVVGREVVGTLLPRIVSLYDEPFADGSALPTWRVSELAHEQVKVVLAGDGGDEIFAGYHWYTRWWQQQEQNRRLPVWLRRGLSFTAQWWPSSLPGGRTKRRLAGMADDPLSQYAHQMELFTPPEKRQVLGREWAAEFANYDDYWYFRQYWRPELDPITRLQYLDLKTYLPDDILTKVDRASMAASVEVRPPLLDHVLIETIFRIPAAIRFRNAEKKYLLKRAVRHLLPSEILARAKKGFSSPLMQWMETEQVDVLARLQQSNRIVRLRSLVDLGRAEWGPKCWALLVLEAWAQREAALA